MPVIKRPTFFRTLGESTKDKPMNTRGINKKIDQIDKRMNELYKDIYISRPDNKDNLDSILDKFDTALDELQLNDKTASRMSELVRRISKDNGRASMGRNTKAMFQSVEELFSDPNLLTTLVANQEQYKYISAQNYQYDMILKYLPKLLDALEIKKDCVLCSDNFSKEYINPTTTKSNKAEVSKFTSNCKRMEKEYDLETFFEDSYMKASIYGEDFVHVIPYNVAFERLIKRTNMRRSMGTGARLKSVSLYESTVAVHYTSETCLTENYTESNSYKEFVSAAESVSGQKFEGFDPKFKGFKLNVHFNDSGFLPMSVQEKAIIDNLNKVNKFKSLGHIHEAGIATGNLTDEYMKVDKKNNGLKAASTSDGLILADELNRDPDKISDDITGAVLERLPRECTIPVYIGKKCFGYYFLEVQEDSRACGYCGNVHNNAGNISNGSAKYAYNMSEDQQELAIRYISARLSASIDTHFINANKDLKEEIYTILRYNEKFDITRTNDIGVTFIPAEDIIHCYFKFDETTHRGVSDLQKSLIPAMLYILLYLTDIIGKVTRSTDKRIYYVKQNIETNVAKTMMNVVNQIKKGNMGMRQIESMNNILNIVGKYNDYIIPLGQSGDPPIQFEVMNGQNIETPTDIMDKMEEIAVNGTGTPFEMVNSTFSQDFAIRFSMTNTRFLKSIYTRQRRAQEFFSKIYTKLYNYEYSENYPFIEVMLPPPTFLAMTNNQQLIDNVTQLVDKIVEIYMTDETDEVKAEFKKIYTRSYMSTYIDFDKTERMIKLAKVNVETAKNPATEEGSGDDDMGDYM